MQYTRKDVTELVMRGHSAAAQVSHLELRAAIRYYETEADKGRAQSDDVRAAFGLVQQLLRKAGIEHTARNMARLGSHRYRHYALLDDGYSLEEVHILAHFEARLAALAQSIQAAAPFSGLIRANAQWDVAPHADTIRRIAALCNAANDASDPIEQREHVGRVLCGLLRSHYKSPAGDWIYIPIIDLLAE